MPEHENRDVVLKLSSIRPMAEKTGKPEQIEVELPNGTKVKVGKAQAARYGKRSAVPAQDPEIDSPEPPADPVDPNATAYDPGQHNVDDVLSYLADADDAERARVLKLEREGKQRQTLINID